MIQIGTGTALYLLTLPFNKSKYLKKNKVYFLLIQISSNNIGGNGSQVSFVYPLCNVIPGNLESLKYISVPETYVSNAYPAGNFY
jgi:hypothetical protein